MRKDAGVDGDAQRIGQLVWMFFLKILDDPEESLMLHSDVYKSPIPAHLRWSAWATTAEGITGDALLDRKSVVQGKSVSVSVDLGDRRILKKQKQHRNRI